ncbi:hypothetical protein D8M15_05235 [Micrococcus sp. HSID17228]|uniref:AtpZ/AtpI family protein n=1 Tax=Micrococcus yunnanensis TaxID=566027 RepID=A0ABR6CXS1_9MICC|nr:MULTISPECIES: hypothetical protein [Micrococcus]MBM4624323.1 hypothetical protein [Micrococcus sp. JV4]MCV7458135.1 hypothetical protein [Micrococcus luteus]RYC99495.1 hypothetical protein SJ20_09005 [Micrococcus sp. MS-ASIII-49]MBA9058649.1 hypothetical protein [Micrococcus yunnanensis]MBE1538752.1 hypothetical protein [Micrococcus yunnanensis]
MAGHGRDEDEAYEAPEAPAGAPAGARNGTGALAQWRIPLVGLLIGVGLGVVFGLGTERPWGTVLGCAMMGFALGIAWMYVERGRDGRDR